MHQTYHARPNQRKNTQPEKVKSDTETSARRRETPPARNGSHNVIQHVTIRLTMLFPTGGPLEQILYLQPFPSHVIEHTRTHKCNKRWEENLKKR